MFVLIVYVWLGGGAPALTMQEFTSRARCVAAGQKISELVSKTRQAVAELERTGAYPKLATPNLIVSKVCVQK